MILSTGYNASASDYGTYETLEYENIELGNSQRDPFTSSIEYLKKSPQQSWGWGWPVPPILFTCGSIVLAIAPGVTECIKAGTTVCDLAAGLGGTYGIICTLVGTIGSGLTIKYTFSRNAQMKRPLMLAQLIEEAHAIMNGDSSAYQSSLESYLEALSEAQDAPKPNDFFAKSTPNELGSKEPQNIVDHLMGLSTEDLNLRLKQFQEEFTSWTRAVDEYLEAIKKAEASRKAL